MIHVSIESPVDMYGPMADATLMGAILFEGNMCGADQLAAAIVK
jgi:hypothetical protein